jgi:hypothetical protein
MTETLPKGWRIQIIDLHGKVQSTIPVSGYPFDVALVSGGVLFSTGSLNATIGAVNHMHLWYWTPQAGSAEVAPAVFQINAEGSLASWVSDPAGSNDTGGGNLQEPRLYASQSPFTLSQPLSPLVKADGSKGIDGASCGSGTVAWWEMENWAGSWQDVLTIWQPGWASPVQIDTQGNEGYRVSVHGGWLVWSEEFGREALPLLERIRGMPIATLASQPRS